MQSQAEDLAGARIGLLVDRWEPSRGGAEAALDALANRLVENGARLFIIAATAVESELPERASWVRVEQRGMTRAQREASLARELVGAAKAAKIELTIGTRHLSEVDLYWPHGGSYAASLRARRESRRRKPEANPRGRHRLFLELERELFTGAGARRIVCVSEMVRREFALAYPGCENRLVTIHNGVDLDRFHPRERLEEGGRGGELRQRLGVPSERPLILFSAREPRLKGLPQLLSALTELHSREFHLLVAGVRRPAAIEKRVDSSGLRPRTSFLANGDPIALSAAADLCVLPTFRDSSSLVTLECLASGTPVITTDRAGAACWIRDRASGEVLADPSNVERLRAAIEERLAGFAPASAEERERVRECVLECDRERWLDALVLEVARLRG